MDSGPHPSQGSSQTLSLALTLQLHSFALAVLLLMSWPAFAAPKLQTFHIDAGDAAVTLTEFSRQSSLQLLFDYSLVRGRRTHPISGELAVEAALGQMLAETGLVFDFVNDRTLAVTLLTREGAGAAVAEASARGSRTRAAETQSVRHEGAGSGALAVDHKAPQLEEVRITGTHVRGEEPVGDRVISYDREQIDASGAATAQDFLHTLPQTFGGGPTEDTSIIGTEARTNSGLGTGINLRGLGAGSTLVLINGKRMAPSGTEGAFADIENIPLSAIERIDILPDSASALYGSDAVGGVVDFVMRDNFTGAETLVHSGSGTQNTLGEYQAAQTLGSRWDSGNGIVSLEFYKRGALPASTRRYARSNLVPFGGGNFDILQSNPGNISVGGQTYAIPSGQNGSGLTAADLLAGTRNRTDKWLGNDLLPSQKRWSLYSSGRQELTEAVHLFGNAMLSQRQARRREPGLGGEFQVTSDNPFYVNPTGGTDPVTVDYNFLDDVGPRATDSRVINTNITFGLDLNAGAAWKVTLYGNYAQDKESQIVSGLVDSQALQAALADPNPATAFNPFGAGSHTNPATLKSIAMDSRFHSDSKLRSVDVTADGPLASLPGGSIKLAVGADHRNQVFDSDYSQSALLTANLSRNVMAAFAEMTVPLFGKANGGAGYRRLELSIAGRYENYSNFGHATTPKFGLVWSPFESVSLRGTWGRSIRAPTLVDLDTTRNAVISLPLPDNSSAAGISPTLVLSGNSTHLTVEHARSWTAGFDIEPREWIRGLTLSATYFNINFRDRIQVPAFGATILDDPRFASFITRNPSAAQLQAACNQGLYVSRGGAGSCLQDPAVAILDLRNQNLEGVRTQGIDFNAQYQRSGSAGTLKLGLDGTYLLHFTQQEGPDAPPAELLDTQNNPISLRMRGNLSWQRLRWGATIGVNFQNNYTDTGSQPHRNIRSYTTFDTQIRYEVAAYSQGFLQNTRVELNAINVFNVSPPFLNNQIVAIGYDEENADPYGRLLSIQVRKTW